MPMTPLHKTQTHIDIAYTLREAIKIATSVNMPPINVSMNMNCDTPSSTDCAKVATVRSTASGAGPAAGHACDTAVPGQHGDHTRAHIENE